MQRTTTTWRVPSAVSLRGRLVVGTQRGAGRLLGLRFAAGNGPLTGFRRANSTADTASSSRAKPSSSSAATLLRNLGSNDTTQADFDPLGKMPAKKLLNVSINGVRYQVPEGISIVEACRAHKVSLLLHLLRFGVCLSRYLKFEFCGACLYPGGCADAVLSSHVEHRGSVSVVSRRAGQSSGQAGRRMCHVRGRRNGHHHGVSSPS